MPESPVVRRGVAASTVPAADPVTFRQGLVLNVLVHAPAQPLATEVIARRVRLPVGPLMVTLRSLQRRGLIRAVRGNRGRPAGWALTPDAAADLGAAHGPQ